MARLDDCTDVLHVQYNPFFPVAARDVVLVRRAMFSGGSGYIVVASVDPEGNTIPIPKGCVRATINASGYHIAISPRGIGTDITYVVNAAVTGWLPTTLLKFINTTPQLVVGPLMRLHEFCTSLASQGMQTPLLSRAEASKLTNNADPLTAAGSAFLSHNNLWGVHAQRLLSDLWSVVSVSQADGWEAPPPTPPPAAPPALAPPPPALGLGLGLATA